MISISVILFLVSIYIARYFLMREPERVESATYTLQDYFDSIKERTTYDPFKDEERIMKGEVESYFE